LKYLLIIQFLLLLASGPLLVIEFKPIVKVFPDIFETMLELDTEVCYARLPDVSTRQIY
jgi:hypothetical protein